MAGNITLRFLETERYDPLKDVQVMCFMAIGDKGTYHTEVEIEGSRSLRRDRQAFKDKVVEYIRAGANPCAVTL
jgi:hypothetical protein